MIQILVCDKVYVTPEMKRKKRLYRLYFFLSIFLVISLCSYYIYADYDRVKSEQVSQEILENIEIPTINIGETVNSGTSTVSVEGDTIVVVLNDTEMEELNIDDILRDAEQQIPEVEEETRPEPIVYTASDGTPYTIVGIIKVPKLNIEYPILSTWNYEILKNATCRYHGPEYPNEVGNFCIIGHNYRNNSFFSKLITLEKMDKIQITDTTGKTVDYIVYDKYNVDPNDTSCTSQKTDGKTEITLITCYNNGTQRTIIKATAI